MAGVYIHIPFCGQLCTYCDFHFSVSLSGVDAMMDAMCCEMRQRNDYLNGESVTTLYLGGGTPSILSILQLKKLINVAETEFHFSVSELEEFTMECNPEDLSRDYLTALRTLGITRLSIGIQSFNEDVLQLMNRRHSVERAVTAVRDAQEVGFANISVDLIFGVRGSSDELLMNDLENLVALQTQHISVYHLTIEEKTVLGWKRRKGEFGAVDEMVSDRQYKQIEERLTEAGFDHYEISNYARKGFRAKHNSGYWNGTHYIGIGPSAHSFDGKSRQWNVAANRKYVESGGCCFEREELTDGEMYDEYVMTCLRTADGVCLEEIERRWGRDRVDYFIKEAEQYFNSGVLVREGSRVRIESSHFLLSDLVIANLMIAE